MKFNDSCRPILVVVDVAVVVAFSFRKTATLYLSYSCIQGYSSPIVYILCCQCVICHLYAPI